MQKRIIIILGAPNTSEGIISDIAKNRLDECLNIYTKDDFVLCTGGWGDHFNTSPKPHSFYAKEYLLRKGIAPTSFLDFALSSNTVEDAVKVKEIISSFNEPLLVIVTSDFHIERTELIFNQILGEYSKIYVGAKTNLSKEEFLTIVEHERKSINGILKNGLYY